MIDALSLISKGFIVKKDRETIEGVELYIEIEPTIQITVEDPNLTINMEES